MIKNTDPLLISQGRVDILYLQEKILWLEDILDKKGSSLNPKVKAGYELAISAARSISEHLNECIEALEEEYDPEKHGKEHMFKENQRHHRRMIEGLIEKISTRFHQSPEDSEWYT